MDVIIYQYTCVILMMNNFNISFIFSIFPVYIDFFGVIWLILRYWLFNSDIDITIFLPLPSNLILTCENIFFLASFLSDHYFETLLINIYNHVVRRLLQRQTHFSVLPNYSVFSGITSANNLTIVLLESILKLRNYHSFWKDTMKSFGDIWKLQQK